MNLLPLRALLEATPYPFLYVMALLRGARVPRNLPKAELMSLTLATLSDLSALGDLLASLSVEERRVLADLVAAGGRLPRYHLARRYGDFREFRPWDAASPTRPWEHPASPVEHLYFLGLIFWDPESCDLLIPAEMLTRYPAPLPPPQGSLAPAAPLPVLHDLAQLLAMLAAEPPCLLHGRWLPPAFLREWGARCCQPPAHPALSGELRAPRRRLLHYLAVAAGLVGAAGPALVLTPAGWEWLAAAPAAQLQALWPAFAMPDSKQWADFRLPAYRLGITTTLHAALVRELTHSATHSAALGSAEALAARLLAHDPAPRSALGAHAWEPEVQITEALVALLKGPLLTLGAITAEASELHLTAWGAYLLEGGPVPQLAPPPPFTLGVDFDFTPPGTVCDPLALVTLATCAVRQPAGVYRLTPASWARALQRGATAAALLTRLNRVAQRPLTGAEVATLTAWAAGAARMHVQRLTVLEVSDPEILVRLQRSRRGRQLVLRTLGRRAVAVDEGKLPLLVRRLTQQEDAPPWVELPQPVTSTRSELGRGGAALLWLAARVYRDLGTVLPLPAVLPDEVLERLAAQLAPGDLTAAEASAQRVRAALQDALAGRSAFPMWTQPTLKIEESLPIIEQALQDGLALELAYYTAGRDETTRRIVEPYRIERRCTSYGEELYLVGFCRRAQAERVFRLDRIRELALVPLVDNRALRTESGVDDGNAE